MLRILLAEDNYGDVVLVRTALAHQRREFELFVAEDGDALAELLAKLGHDIPAPDLLLLDINLPRIEGPVLFRMVRDHPLCAKLPLIVVSSSDSLKDHEWTEQFGVAAYFRKPSDFDQFMQLGAVVRNLMQQPGTAGQS